MILTDSELVLRQGCIDGFSITVVFRNKAQYADNGSVLVKCCNAVAEHHSGGRMVDLSAPMAALHLLRRTMAIHCETCLAMNTDRPTEPINTTLTEY